MNNPPNTVEIRARGAGILVAQEGPESLVATLSLRPLLVELDRRGLDAETLLQPFGISSADVTEPLARVPESVLWGIWGAAVKMTGDPALGVEVGCQFEPQSLGILGHLLANSASVGDALNRWQEFTHLIADQPLFELQPQQGLIRMEWRRRPDIDPSANRSLIEFATFSSLRLLAYLTGSGALLTAPIQRLCFRHQQPEPALLNIYRGHLPNVELAFGQAANAIEVDTALLDQAVVYADTQMLELMADRARQQLRDQHRGHYIVLRVQKSIRRHLTSGNANILQVAKDLSMSRSTLQRQLAATGISFRALLDEIRRDIACEMLREWQQPIDSVAIALGYAEAAAFIHAFKRWTGTTPGEWRRQHSK